MGRDLREFVFMDAGYTDNPKWFRVMRSMQDAMPDALQGALPDALLDAMREAMHLHHASIEYCFEHRTDGVFPVQAVKIKAQCRREYAVTALFDVGLWINLPGGMAEVHDYLQHQRSAAEMEEASRRGKKAATARWGDARGNAVGNARRNAVGNAVGNAEERRGEERSKRVTSAVADPPTTRRHPRVPLPTDWSPKPQHIEKAGELHLNLSREVERFKNSAATNDRRYANWDTAFSNWLLKSVEYAARDGLLVPTATSQAADPWASIPWSGDDDE